MVANVTTTELAVVPDTQPDIQPDELFSVEDAKQITEEILGHVTNVADLIVIAYQRRAWAALGYDSWDAYVDSEFQGAPLALPREKRQEAVLSLKKQGLSLRAIASATGTSPQTVANDVAAATEAAAVSPVQLLDTSQLTEEQHVRLDELQAKESSDDEFLSDEEHAELQELRETIAIDAEIVEEEAPAAPVQGLDGKEYKQPVAKEPKPVADKAPKVAQVVKDAKRIAKGLGAAQELLNNLLTDVEYINSDKATKAAVDEALAQGVVDLLEELEIKVPAKWLKLV